MSPPMSRQGIVVVSCAAFQAEIEALAKTDWPDLTFHFLDSMYHMNPEKLSSQINLLIQGEIRQGNKVVLVYGDCCSKMTSMAHLPGVVRVRGNNCCEMILGKEAYRRLSHEGVFFLFPEWTHRWQRVFSQELGLNHDNAKSLMGDMHHKLVYLDTGIVPVPEREFHMKKDNTEKILSVLAKKVGQSVRAKARSVRKKLKASFREEMSHAKTDARTIAGRKPAGKA